MRSNIIFEQRAEFVLGNATLNGIEDDCYSATNWPSTTPTFVVGELSIDLSSRCNLPGGLAAIDTNGARGFSNTGSAIYQIQDTTSMWYGPSLRSLIPAQRITAD